MIHTPAKTYQVTLWLGEDREGGQALQMHFDTRAEAEAVLAAKQAEGRYRAGILVEWDKQRHDWTLLSRYPD